MRSTRTRLPNSALSHSNTKRRWSGSVTWSILWTVSRVSAARAIDLSQGSSSFVADRGPIDQDETLRNGVDATLRRHVHQHGPGEGARQGPVRNRDEHAGVLVEQKEHRFFGESEPLPRPQRHRVHHCVNLFPASVLMLMEKIADLRHPDKARVLPSGEPGQTGAPRSGLAYETTP